MEKLKQIGKLGKPRGVKGDIRVFVEDRFEEVLFAAKHVFVEQQGQHLPYFIANLQDAGHLLIRFEDVNGKELAAALANAPILLPESSLQNIEEDDDLAAWIGFTISDDNIGVIGKITDLLELKDQFLAQVNYEGKEVYIPLHEDLILDIQPDKQLIHMDLPEGILDM